MHGLVNRSIESFLRHTYGNETWGEIADQAGIDRAGFEAMMVYDDAVTNDLLRAAAIRLDRPVEAIAEDVGAYLVGYEPLRRLLRFGGVEYIDFLLSLDELPDRAHLAVPDLDMPDLEISGGENGHFELCCKPDRFGFSSMLAGLVRAMADDYGALALIECAGGGRVTIDLLDERHARGRAFDLTKGGAV
ncbi:heme-NO-binding protein [Albidovulum inexpectatum]|uniref:Heme-NO-binding protein n=1 Tax=Albidovulum inexpectatum TaxID=196587 RepID=A0A2S5JFM0_9RHOB|nr:heme NO-binding domain-containing protein [Albidovulum inexpectatum]PPB80220.1 heme-NO-binding protein [Albidovulum inexpectatum]